SASAAAGGDPAILEVAMNCAPALSLDGNTLYIGVSAGDFGAGYLVAVDSHSLAPVARIRLQGPEFRGRAPLPAHRSAWPSVGPDSSSASPTVGPDGDVYYGVFEAACCSNDARGWLLHFDGRLSQSKTPGAFGWDTTPTTVPASAVPSYHGASTYLLFTKYNN